MLNTYILERAVWQLATPLVLDLRDLSSVFVVEDINPALNGLFLLNAFGDIASRQIHADRVTSTDNFMMEPLDLREGSLKAVLNPFCEQYPSQIAVEAYPLWFELLASSGNGNIVLEYSVVIPQGQLLQRRAPSKKL